MEGYYTAASVTISNFAVIYVFESSMQEYVCRHCHASSLNSVILSVDILFSVLG